MTVVGLIVEGVLDFPVLSRFIEAELPVQFPRPVKFIHLQPQPDATQTGRYSGGGWRRVVGWCTGNSGTRVESFFSPIEEGDQPCDLILIHLDGDALQQCAQHSAVSADPEPVPADERVNTLERVVVDLLKPPDSRVGQFVFAFPTMHTEAWLLAALRPDALSWEAEADSKRHFQALRPRGTNLTLRDFYDAKSLECAPLGNDIARQCVSFSHFRDCIRSVKLGN